METLGHVSQLPLVLLTPLFPTAALLSYLSRLLAEPDYIDRADEMKGTTGWRTPNRLEQKPWKRNTRNYHSQGPRIRILPSCPCSCVRMAADVLLHTKIRVRGRTATGINLSYAEDVMLICTFSLSSCVIAFFSSSLFSTIFCGNHTSLIFTSLRRNSVFASLFGHLGS